MRNDVLVMDNSESIWDLGHDVLCQRLISNPRRAIVMNFNLIFWNIESVFELDGTNR